MVSELIKQRFIFGDVMKSAASAPGPAHWSLQPLLYGHAHWLQRMCSDHSQSADLEPVVWRALNFSPNQHS